jgi:hypothetical protein
MPTTIRRKKEMCTKERPRTKKRSASKKTGREDESAIEEEVGDRKIERRDDWKDANVEVEVMISATWMYLSTTQKLRHLADGATC